MLSCILYFYLRDEWRRSSWFILEKIWKVSLSNKTRKFGENWGVGVLRKVSIDRCSHSSSSEMWMTRSLSLLLTCAYVSVFDGLQRNEDVLWLASKKCWTELLSLLKKGKYLRFSKQSIRGMQIKSELISEFFHLDNNIVHCPACHLLSRKKLVSAQTKKITQKVEIAFSFILKSGNLACAQ